MAELIEKKAHLTPEGLNKINNLKLKLKLKLGMNKGRY